MKFSRFVLALATFLSLCAAPALSQVDATKAFRLVNDDLRVKSKTMTPYEYVAFAEKALLDFIKKYPKSPETAQAHFGLGTIYTQMGASGNAITQLREYLAMPGEKGGADMVAQAKYILGRNYMGLEMYDDAERALKDVVSAGVTVDSRITQAAAAELSRIAVLRKLRIGAPAIDISTTSFQGKKIQLLKGYKGKVVLLDFWAAWCNPCRQEMPNVIKIYNELHKKGFEIIGISLDSEKQKFEGFIRDNRMEWPQIYDGKFWSSEYARLYAVNSIPATFLIDKKGIIRFKNVRGEALRDAVLQLLNEN